MSASTGRTPLASRLFAVGSGSTIRNDLTPRWEAGRRWRPCKQRRIKSLRGLGPRGDGPALGLRPRRTGPGDRVSLPYFSVSDMEATLNRSANSAERSFTRGAVERLPGP